MQPRHHGLLLDDQLCFAVASAHRAVVAAYAPLLAPLELTHPQYLLLLVLWERGVQPVSALARALHLDNGTVTPLLKRLESRGLIARRRSVDDERVVEIHLTAAGKALYDKAKEVPKGIACAAGLDGAQLVAVRDALQLLTHNLRVSVDDDDG